MTEETNNENIEQKAPIMGEFSLPGVIGFVSLQGNTKIKADDAFINGGQLSGMCDHLVFKLTIRDNETVDFEELNSNETDSAMRGRLLDVLLDSEPIPGKLGGMYNPSSFTFISTVESKITEKQIPLVLLTTYKSPIDLLGEISLDDEPTEVVLNDSERNSINDFLLGLGVETDTETIEATLDVDHITEEEEKVTITEDSQFNELKISKEEMIQKEIITTDEFGLAILESNEYIISELTKRIIQKQQEINSSDIRKNKISEEIIDLENRIKVISKKPNSNGMLFCVSEQLENDKDENLLDTTTLNIIREKIKVIPNINAGAFINLFKLGRYIITIGDQSGDLLNEKSPDLILPDNTRVEDGKFIYVGELKWHDLVEEMINLGYGQDAEFDKKAGSNSYVFIETLNPDLPIPNPVLVSNPIVTLYQRFIAWVKSKY